MGKEKREQGKAMGAVDSKGLQDNGSGRPAGATRDESLGCAAGTPGGEKIADEGEQRDRKRGSRRYAREWLLKIQGRPEMSKPPSGFNAALLKPCEINNERPSGWRAREGREGREGWHPPSGVAKGQIHSRLVDDGKMDQSAKTDQPGDGKWLTTRSSFKAEGGLPANPPRRTRSEQPGRWDTKKAAEDARNAATAAERRGPPGMERRVSERSKGERWGSYGHRDKSQFDKEGSGAGWSGEPEWMHDVGDGENGGMSQQARAAFEEQHKKFKENWSKKGGSSQNTVQALSDLFMSDDDINKMRHSDERQTPPPGSSAAASASAPANVGDGGRPSVATFSFDSFKEAIKQAGVPNLPPLPTTFSTVDEIEKQQRGRVPQQGAPGFTRGQHRQGMPQFQMPPMPQQYKSVGDLEREQYGIGTAGAAGLHGTAAHPIGNGSMDGAHFLLSLLKGQANAASMQQPGMAAMPGGPPAGQMQPQYIPGVTLPMSGQGNGALQALLGQQQRPMAMQLPRQDNVLGRLFAAAAQKNAPPSAGVLPNPLLHQHGHQANMGQLQPQGNSFPQMPNVQQNPFIRSQQGNPLVAHDPGLAMARNAQMGGGFPSGLFRPAPQAAGQPGVMLSQYSAPGASQSQFLGQAQMQMHGAVPGHQDPLVVRPSTLAQLQGIQSSQGGQPGLERFFNLNSVGGLQPGNLQAKPMQVQQDRQRALEELTRSMAAR